jgi:hypothetical protein
VKILSLGEQRVSSDEEENVSDNSSMQHDIWAKSGAERPCFIFTGKSGLHIDLEDPSNLLEYFELTCTPEIWEVIARETNQYAQQFLENMSKLKLRSKANHWKEMNRNEIMKSLVFLLLQGLHPKLDNRSYFFPREKFWKCPYFWTFSPSTQVFSFC